jgi:hypothetical protein
VTHVARWFANGDVIICGFVPVRAQRFLRVVYAPVSRGRYCRVSVASRLADETSIGIRALIVFV